jgi:N-carbamoylputrescine amidase
MNINVTVCELGNRPDDLARDWQRLVDHVRAAASELVVLPEMAFAPWFAATRDFDQPTWGAAVAAHERWLERLPELGDVAVVGTRPIDSGGRRLNQGFVWEPGAGYRAAHDKYYLPDEEGFWEASWYERGDGEFAPVEARGARVGVQICTELWFMERARAYGKAGAHLLAVPRATPRETVDKWLAGGRTAAVVAGAFALSSCPVSGPGEAANLGGQGWVVGPEGDVLAVTSRERPFATVAIDLGEAERAKQTYPRYVRE